MRLFERESELESIRIICAGDGAVMYAFGSSNVTSSKPLGMHSAVEIITHMN